MLLSLSCLWNNVFIHFRYSALKKNGQRMSVLLKRGHQLEAKPARPVKVYNLNLQEFKPPLFTLGEHVLFNADIYLFYPLSTTVLLAFEYLNYSILFFYF